MHYMVETPLIEALTALCVNAVQQIGSK